MAAHSPWTRRSEQSPPPAHYNFLRCPPLDPSRRGPTLTPDLHAPGMGKPSEIELSVAAIFGSGGGVGGDGAAARVNDFLRPCAAAASLRCVAAVVLSFAVFLSAMFWLPPFFHLRSVGFVSSDPRVLAAEVQATFILQKPVSFLTSHIDILERDLYDEIGVPNSTVSIISMQPLDLGDSSVLFGVLSNRDGESISLPALSVLRSSLIELVLQQLNLSLTPKFGLPSSFELVQFPGGISVVPVQSAFIWERTQVLFNFTLNDAVYRILTNIDQLKDQLKLGLNLRSNENVCVQLTNTNGSTLSPPTTVQASVLSDHSNNLLPDRLRQLADLLSDHERQNLGLNHSVFGRVKSVQLSSYLNASRFSPAPAPSPSPSISPSTSPFPAPNGCVGFPVPTKGIYLARAPSPSTNMHHHPRHNCDSLSPSEVPTSKAGRRLPRHSTRSSEPSAANSMMDPSIDTLPLPDDIPKNRHKYQNPSPDAITDLASQSSKLPPSDMNSIPLQRKETESPSIVQSSNLKH